MSLLLEQTWCLNKSPSEVRRQCQWINIHWVIPIETTGAKLPASRFVIPTAAGHIPMIDGGYKTFLRIGDPAYDGVLHALDVVGTRSTNARLNL